MPRCTFEFFKDMTATEVVLEVGSIVILPQYPFATAKGLLITAVTLRTVPFTPTISSDDFLEGNIESSV